MPNSRPRSAVWVRCRQASCLPFHATAVPRSSRRRIASSGGTRLRRPRPPRRSRLTKGLTRRQQPDLVAELLSAPVVRTAAGLHDALRLLLQEVQHFQTAAAKRNGSVRPVKRETPLCQVDNANLFHGCPLLVGFTQHYGTSRRGGGVHPIKVDRGSKTAVCRRVTTLADFGIQIDEAPLLPMGHGPHDAGSMEYRRDMESMNPVDDARTSGRGPAKYGGSVSRPVRWQGHGQASRVTEILRAVEGGQHSAAASAVFRDITMGLAKPIENLGTSPGRNRGAQGISVQIKLWRAVA